MQPEKKKDLVNKRRSASGRQGSRARPAARVSASSVAPPKGEHQQIGARKLPRQRRSREMVDAIMQAAAEIFAQQGYARSNTNKIAARAGVSVGSLYQYFPNKDSLLAELLVRHHAEVHVVLGRALDVLEDHRTPLESGLRQLIEELVALHLANPALTRALSAAVLRESPASDEVHKGHDDQELAARVMAILCARPDVRAGDPGLMAMVLGQAVAQLSRWMVHDLPRGTDQQRLMDEVVLLLSRYLGAR